MWLIISNKTIYFFTVKRTISEPILITSMWWQHWKSRLGDWTWGLLRFGWALCQHCQSHATMVGRSVPTLLHIPRSNYCIYHWAPQSLLWPLTSVSTSTKHALIVSLLGSRLSTRDIRDQYFAHVQTCTTPRWLDPTSDTHGNVTVLNIQTGNKSDRASHIQGEWSTWTVLK